MKMLARTALACLLGATAAAHAQTPAAAPPAPPPDGAHATPSLYWKDGPHRVDVGLAARVRMESWDGSSATNTDWDSYTGTRLRLSLRYTFEDRLAVFVEGQFATVHGLDADLGPPARNYFTSTGSASSAHGEGVRQAYLEVRPAKGAALRGGRQDVKVGTDVVYPEANWKYLKTARLGERLVGTVGWTHVERSYDAATLAVDTGPYAVYAFVGRPTTGVFDVDSAYRPLHGLVLGGATFTAKRGSWLPNTELGAFAIAYEDERPTTRGGIAGGVDVTTIGGYSLGVYPLGPAQVDAIAWFAGQTGKYGGQHHGAYAGIFEAGVQLPAVFAKPWLRLGVNFASGDSNPTDGHHETFFNLLPSNHPYYGFADQLAFENLENVFVQLRLAPLERLQLNAFVHYLSLMEANDARYAGGGAFSTKSFGFTAFPSNGARKVGVEYDLVATIALHKALTLELGGGHIDAGRVLPRDVSFLYASLEAKY